MANIVNEEEKSCACGACPTSATITEYSCGCVVVDIHNDTDPCDSCSSFSNRAESCGQDGDPSDHED